MATPKQITANRLNALKSTGPVSPAGKAIVAQNAITHGLTAAQAVIPGENPEAFDAYRSRMIAQLDPVGPIESLLAERIVSLSWRLSRAARLQSAALFARYTHRTHDSYTLDNIPWRLKENPLSPADQAQFDMGDTVIEDFQGPRVLDNLLTHERRIEQSLFKTLMELQKTKYLRSRTQDDTAPEPKQIPSTPADPHNRIQLNKADN